MAMSQSERLRLLVEGQTKIIARSKCRDSSELTMIRQAQASGTAAPKRVATVIDQKDCATNAVATGKGANMEYTGILQAAQKCAVCKDPDVSASPFIVIPGPCANQLAPPFTQQNLSTMYVAPCTDPGKRDYFPPPIYDGPGCKFNRITTPSG